MASVPHRVTRAIGRRRLLVLGLDDAAHRADRRGAADRESGGDEQRLVAGQAERAAEADRADEGEQHDRDDHDDRQPAEAEDVDQAEFQPEQHDAEAHELLGGHRQSGREDPVQRAAGCGDLADDDAERHGRREQRYRRNERVDRPRQREPRHPREQRRATTSPIEPNAPSATPPPDTRPERRRKQGASATKKDGIEDPVLFQELCPCELVRAEPLRHRAVERVAGREPDPVQVVDDDAVGLEQAVSV